MVRGVKSLAQVLLRDVTKRFGNVVAVNNISLDVKDREFIVLVGPSGRCV